MKREVIWIWAAEADAQDAFLRMEETTALRFVATTDSLVALLQSFPQLASMWHPPVRRALIRRSHFGLFYVIEPKRLVILALQDLRQDPDRLKREVLRRLP